MVKTRVRIAIVVLATLCLLGGSGVLTIPAFADEPSGDVQKVLDRFFAETGWHPQHVKPVAGALLYTQYNFLIRFVLKHIAKQAGGSTDTSRNHDYTDWIALDQFVAALAEEFSS